MLIICYMQCILRIICRRFRVSTFWFIDVSVCRSFGLSTFRSVDVLVCRRFGLSTFRFVEVLVCRRFGLSAFRFVNVSVGWEKLGRWYGDLLVTYLVHKGESQVTVGNQLPSTQLPSTKNGGGVER